MGKKRTAARRAAAAATTASAVPPPPLPAASDDNAVVSEHPELRTALTQRPHDAHAANTCPVPRVSSLAPPTSSLVSHATTETTQGIRAAPADAARPHAVATEPKQSPATTITDPREPRSQTAYHAPRNTSPVSHTHIASPNDVPAPTCTLADGNEMEHEVRARREGWDVAHGEYTPQALRGTSLVQHTRPVSPTTSPALHIRPAASHDVPASPSSSTHPRAAENESGGLVGAHEDDPYALHTHPMPHIPHLAQHPLPTAFNDVSAPTHNNIESPTPGIEPGEPRMAAAYGPPESEPAFVDRAYHDSMVAIAIQKGFDGGLKAGRNEGFREGLDAGTRTGPRQAREEGRNEGTARGSLEVSTPDSVSDRIPAIQTPPYPTISIDSTSAALHDPQPACTPTRLAKSIDEIDADLLARVRKEAEYGVWEEGLEAGMTMGRKEGREAGYSEGLEAGRKMGIMAGRERGFEDGKSAGVQAGRVLERVEVRRIVRPSVHVQTDNRPTRTYVNAAVRTFESLPTPRIEAAIQTLPLYAAAMPLIEDPDPALLDPTHLKEIVVTALSDGHAAGLKEGWNVGLQEGHATGRKVGMIEGRERGFDEGKSAGMKVGREQVCAEARRTMRTSCQVQTDDLPIPIHAAALPAPFSWADDADSLPILTPPPLGSAPPRDFSILRSNLVSQPFGSIQRRVRRSLRHGTRVSQFHQYRSPPSSALSWRSSILPAHPVRPVQHCASDLAWATDPRLSELSRVLQGLGWVHSSFSSGQVSEATRTLPCRRGAHGVGRLGLPPSRGWVSSGV